MNAAYAGVLPVLLEQNEWTLAGRVTQLPAALARCDAMLLVPS